jgi:hypothetical protein
MRLEEALERVELDELPILVLLVELAPGGVSLVLELVPVPEPASRSDEELCELLLELEPPPLPDPLLTPEQTSSLHASPSPQSFSLQQGSPPLPQLRHTPPPHVNPVLQAVSLQQGSPPAPHLSGASVAPPSRVVETLRPFRLAQPTAAPTHTTQASARFMVNASC